LSNILILPFGLSDKNFSGTLYHPSTTNDGQATLCLKKDEKVFKSEKVEVKRLESIIEDYKINKIHGIKIDIEGAELRALSSAGNLFSREDAPRFVLFECIESHLNRYDDTLKDIINFFSMHQYFVWYYKKGTWRKFNTDKYIKDGSPSDMIAVRKSHHIDPNK